MARIYPPELMPYACIVDAIRDSLGQDRTMVDEIDTQLICLMEEVGELAKAWRRMTGRARIYDTLDNVVEELADVQIAAHVMFMMLGADEAEAVQKKLRSIVERGGR